MEVREEPRDLARLVVPLSGALEETGGRWLPFRLVDPAGTVVQPVSAFFADLLAAGRSEATVRSYGMDLLRWFRFLWAAGVPWNRATRIEARDFCRWMQVAGKPARPHWRTPDRVPDSAGYRRRRMRRRCERIARRCCAVFTTFTWRRAPGRW